MLLLLYCTKEIIKGSVSLDHCETQPSVYCKDLLDIISNTDT